LNGSRGGKNSIQVKICGITHAVDAQCAIDCGADALGFNFYPRSKRFLDFDSARDWLKQLPPGVLKVAVLVNPAPAEAIHFAQTGIFDWIQLHGNESPEFCRKLAERGIRFAKALPIVNEDSLLGSSEFFTDTVLLDSSGSGGFGGTGRAFPWDLGRRFVEDHPNLRVILAGGLTPQNVGEAIRLVCPFGVDVTSGVEASPGRKDPGRLRAFISAVRGG
jgi:phosphoribosylanthranilate isomerase